MASILKNPRLLLVLCVTASFSSAAPNEDRDPRGRIAVQVYSGNRRYPYQSSPVQEADPRTLTNRRVDGQALPAARPSVTDGTIRGPYQTYHGSVGRAREMEHRRVTEVPPAAYARPSYPEASQNRPVPRGGNQRDHRRRYLSYRGFTDRSSYGGSRYGVRRRIQWKSPSEEEKVNRRREMAVPLSRPLTVHPTNNPPTDAKQDKGRKKKWIHCHHDGIAFVSEDAVPQVSRT